MQRIFRAVFLMLAVGAWLTPAAFAADAAAGKAKYDLFCTTCHGPGGKGDGPAGAALTPPPRDFSVGDFKFDADKDGTPGTDKDLELVIANGAGAYGGNPSMAPWGPTLSDEDMANIIAFVRSLKK